MKNPTRTANVEPPLRNPRPRRMRTASTTRVTLGLVLALFCSAVARGQEAAGPPASDPGEDAVLRVATKAAPPFAMEDEFGTWTGIAIELWADVGAELGLEYELVETDLEGLLEGVATGAFDAGVAAVTVTEDRERALDFTHAFYMAGLGIAVEDDAGFGFLRGLRGFPFLEFGRIVGVLALILLVVGALVWVFERRRNESQFPPGYKGVGDGFWWSAVTMTTVGYGDLAPRTLGGRAIALVWMFTSIVLISVFTGTLASVLTAGQIGSVVDGPEDLADVETATVTGSTSASYLASRRVGAREFSTLREALEALNEGKVQAVVYDAPILRHRLTEERFASLTILPSEFETQHYAIALPENSRWREAIDRALLKVVGSASYQETLQTYLGSP